MAYPDFEEFIAELNAHGVRYLIVGAHALAHHARPRATKDLDVLIDSTEENAARVIHAIQSFFGGADLGYEAGDLIEPGWHLQLGVAPVRIDILSSILGCPDFAPLWDHRVTARFGDQPACYLSLEDLIVAKETAARPQDVADVVELKKARDSANRSSDDSAD